MIGIIGAMPEEIAALLESLEVRIDIQKGPFTLHKGLLEGKSVVISRCGIGKVNAAALTQTMIFEGVQKIIFTGVAGGLEPSLEIGDIVISTDCLQHDVDVTALAQYQPGQIPGEMLAWPADQALQMLALLAAGGLEGLKVVSGRILSGDQFLNSSAKIAWLRETFAGACVEMEGAGVAQVCSKWQVPFVVIRSISDTGDEASAVDFREFTPLAAERAKQVVRAMLRDTRI